MSRVRRISRCCPLMAAITGVLIACDPGVVSVVRPGTGDDSDVRRTTLTIHAVVDPADSALADSLGWDSGVPGVEVHLLRNGTAEWLVQETDSSGTVVFEHLLPGLHRVYGSRVLTTAEAQRVGGVTRALGDGRTLTLGNETALDLMMHADRPRSLVFSEIGNGVPPPWESGGGYVDGMYIELYNNGDSTVFLDGMLLGHTYFYGFKDYDYNACSVSTPVRTDSAGLYTNQLLAFPGAGVDYPIDPGETRIIAMSAIDHTPVHPTLSDLSGADFEVGGRRTADNPAVPNMVDVGPKSYFLYPPGFLITSVTFLVGALDVSQLPVLLRDHTGAGYVRVPREALIDVMAHANLWADLDRENPPCAPMVHRIFDRYEGGFVDVAFESDVDYRAIRSLQRHALRLVDGRIILMNTNTSAVDFFHGLKTPGALPPLP